MFLKVFDWAATLQLTCSANNKTNIIIIAVESFIFLFMINFFSFSILPFHFCFRINVIQCTVDAEKHNSKFAPDAPNKIPENYKEENCKTAAGYFTW